MTTTMRARVPRWLTLVGLIYLMIGWECANRALSAGPPRLTPLDRRSPSLLPAAPNSLGSFTPTPTLYLGQSPHAQGGYAPLGVPLSQSTAYIGPISALRPITDTQTILQRGFDGRTRLTSQIKIVYPFAPTQQTLVVPVVDRYGRFISTGYRLRVNQSSPGGINYVDLR